MHSTRLILWLFAVVLTFSAHADEKTDCSNPKFTVDFNHCAEQGYKAADKKLNDTYRKVSAALPEEDRKGLVAIQRDWLKLRDQHCELETRATRQGTVWFQLNTECKTRLTQSRTVDIESLLQYR